MSQQLFDFDTTQDEAELCLQSIEAFDEKLRPYFKAKFLEANAAEHLFEQLRTSLNWQQPSIRIAGKQMAIPRLQSWQGEQAFRYRYSGQTFTAEAIHPAIVALKQEIEALLDAQNLQNSPERSEINSIDRSEINSPERSNKKPQRFNSVLCNLYRNERDSVAWHADDEPELGPAPLIASFSLGATRTFEIKPSQGGKAYKLALPHNSLLVMPAGFQAAFVHQIPKSKTPCSARINLTFRLIV